MVSTRQHLKVVLLDKAALQRMRFIEMVSRIDQIRATGRYKDIRIDGELGAVTAEMVA